MMKIIWAQVHMREKAKFRSHTWVYDWIR